MQCSCNYFRACLLVPTALHVICLQVTGLDQMADFSHLHDAAILYNVQRRFLEERPYTHAGQILLSVNPHRVITDRDGISIFDPIYMHRYRMRMPDKFQSAMPQAGREAVQLPPHVYDAIEEALTNLRSNLLPQAVVLRGESGSGKSENAKHMVTYMMHSSTAAAVKLAEEGNGTAADISDGLSSPPASGRSAVQSPTRTTSARLRLKQSDLSAARADALARSGPLGSQANPFYSADLGRAEQRVLGTEVVIEAFSHAGTHANRNASRALRNSKYHFHPNGRLVCAQHSSFLLDVSRVTHVPYVPGASWASASAQAGYKGFAPHTNYHVFYYLLAGARRELRASLRFGTGEKHMGVQIADSPVGYRYLRPAAPKDDVNTQQAAMASGAIGHEELAQISSRGAVTLNEEHAAKFELLCEALAQAGVEGEAQYHLWHAVAGILHLGNITFTPPPAGSGADAGVAAEPQSVEHAASVLGVTREALLEEVTFRPPVSNTAASAAARTRIKTVAEAQANVDAMARRMYFRLFNWLVAQMNAASRGSSAQQWQEAAEAVPEMPVDPIAARFNAGAQPAVKEPLYVSLLDTPGFEMMPGGGVEGGSPHDISHLFANHVSERLHAEFVDRVFKSEQRVYEAERIDGRHIQYAENKDVLASMENPRTGLLMMLEEQSSHRRATDQALLHKLHTMQKRNPAYVKPGNRIVAQSYFALRHTPAAVTYCVDGTLSTNRVQLQDSISAMLESNSSRPLIALLASNSNVSELLGSSEPEAPGTPGASGVASASGSPDSATSGTQPRTPRRGGGALPTSAIERFWGSNFSQTLDTCLAALRGCEVHFVLCLRPNVLGAPNFVEPALLHHQLVYSNVMHTVALKHSGFSYRTIFEDFYARFIIIAQQSGNLVYPPPPHANMRALCKELLQQLVTHPVFEAVDVARSAQLGVSKIFLRKHMIDTLNALREVRMKAMDRMATKAQSMWKGAFTRLRLRQMWRGLEELQVNWRAHMHRAAWLRRLWAARRIQHAVRGWRAERRWNIVRTNIQKLQGWYKSVAARRRFQSNQNGLRLLHTLARGYIVRQHVLGMLENVVKLQTVARDFLVRNKNYYRKARAAARIQAAWRGYKWRWDAEDVLEYLALKRLDRAMDKAAAVLQAFWRGVLVWRRYNQIRNAALTIQRYIRSKSQRALFLRLRSAVRLAQHVARTHLRHKETMRVANLRSLADELWRLQLLRERECQDLAEANGVEAVCGVSAVRALALQGTRGTHVLTALLDVDCAVDVSDVYSTGFVRMYDELVTSLTDAGHRVAGLAVGGAHVMVLTDHGVVYTWGFGDRGQAGHGEWEPTWTPRRVETLATGARASHVLQALEVGYKAARIAAARSSHASASKGGDELSSSGTAGSKRALASASAYADLLGAAGVNSPLGLLGVSGGVPEPGMSTPFTLGGIKRALKSGVTIKQIAAGEEHSLALTTSGAVFAWGEGRRGQLGLGSKVAVSVPTPVAALQRKVSSITAGSAHSAALLSTGGVMVWGAGPALGIWAQPAVHSDIESAVPQVGPKDTKRSQAAAGRDAGPDLSFLRPWLASPPADDKQWAELLATIPDMPVPQLVRILRFDGDRVRHLEAGGDVTAATTAEGRVYTWGVSKAGALGHGDTDPRLVPTLVRGLLPPTSSRSSPAGSPSAAPASPPMGGLAGTPGASTPTRGAGQGTAESKADSPGDGASVVTAATGATGATGATSKSRAAHYRINMTAVGITHCVAVGATGRVYVWGGNSAGQLGLGDTDTRLSPTPLKSLSLRRVVQASASARSTHVLTDFNEVLAWGAAGSMRSPIATTAWDAPWGAKPSRKQLPSQLPVNTVFRTLVPLEVPFHDVPSRVPKRLLGAKSRALGLTGLVYSQAPLNDAQAHSVLFGLNKSNATPADPLQLSLNAAQASAAHEAELMHSAAAGSVDAADLLATASRSTRRLKMAARLQAKEKSGASPGEKVAPLRFGENSMFDPALVSVDPVTDLCKAVEIAHDKRSAAAVANAVAGAKPAESVPPGAGGVSVGAPLRDGQIRSALDGSVGRPITPVQMASQLPQCGPRVAAALLGGLTPQRLAEVTIEQLYVLLAQLQKHSRSTAGQVASGKLSRAGGRASVLGWGVSSTPGVSAVSGHKGDEGDAKPALPISERKRRKYRAVLNALEHTAATAKAAAAAAAAAAAKGQDGPTAARNSDARRRAGLAGKTPSTPDDAGAPRDALQPFSHSRGWGADGSPGSADRSSTARSSPYAAREAGWTAHFAHSPAHKSRTAGVADESPLAARGTGTYVGSRGGAPAGPRRVGPSDGRTPAMGQSASDAVDAAGRSSRRDQLQSFTHSEADSTGELSNVAHALAVATAADALETPEHDELYEERNRSPAARRRRAVRASLPDLGPMGYKGYLREEEDHSPPRPPQPQARSPSPTLSHDELRMDALQVGTPRVPRAGSPEATAAAARQAQRTPGRKPAAGKAVSESPLHALFSPAHLVATSNDDMEYKDIVAAYHSGAAGSQHASPGRRPPPPGAPQSPKRVFASDSERKSRRLEGLMSPAAAAGAASPGSPGSASIGGQPSGAAPPQAARGTPQSAGLAEQSARNRRASEVRAAFPRAMGHQSTRPPAAQGSASPGLGAAVPAPPAAQGSASPGLGAAVPAPPAMPDLSAAPRQQTPSRSPAPAHGAPVTVRSLVRTASETMTAVAQSASAASSARSSPAAAAPVSRTAPSAARAPALAPAPAPTQKQPVSSGSAAAAEAARKAATRALSHADEDVAVRRQMEAELAASEAELKALRAQQEQHQGAKAAASADDVRRSAAAAAAATWEAGEKSSHPGSQGVTSPRPMPSLGDMFGKK